MSATVFVYGFPPGMELEEFKTEFFEGIDIDSYVQRIDFKKEKIFAFIHVNTVDQANELINKWNGKPMAKSGENHKIQVSLKSENPHAMNAANKPNNNMNNNMNQNAGGMMNKPYNNNRNFNNNNNNQNGMNNNNMRNNFNNNFNNNRGNNNRNNYNNFNQQGGYNNFNQQQGGYNNNSFNNQRQFNNNRGNNNFNNNNNNNGMNNNTRANNTQGTGDLPGPQKPVLYVYGFPKEIDQATFEEAFLGGEGENNREQLKQNDYFQEKIYAFLHFESHDVCEELIARWDGKHLDGYEQGKPMQVRYKGMDHKTINLLNNTQPVLWVYGFPKGMTEEQFREEFLLGLEVSKIDFFDQKLFCFIHCEDTKQCMKYINRWEGQMMSTSKSALQVRFKGANGNRDNANAGAGAAAGGNQQQNNKMNQYGNQNNFYNNNQGMGDMQNNAAAMYQNTFQQSYYNNNMQMQGNNRNNNFNNQMNQMNQMTSYGYNNQNNNNRNNTRQNNTNSQNNNQNNNFQMGFQQMNQGQNWNQNNMMGMQQQQGYNRQNNSFQNNNRAR